MPNTTNKDYTKYSQKQLLIFKFYQGKAKKSVRKIERNPNSKTKD